MDLVRREVENKHVEERGRSERGDKEEQGGQKRLPRIVVVRK